MTQEPSRDCADRRSARQVRRATRAIAACSALLVSILWGCAAPPPPPPAAPKPSLPRSYVVLLESPDGSVGAVEVKSARGSTVLTRRLQAASLDTESPGSFVLSQAQLERDFADALAARPLPPANFRLYFATGEARLSPASERLIEEILAAARERPAADVSVIGHTDTVGDAHNNERLGLQRARWVSDLLARRGLAAVEVTIASHGERDLLVRTPDETDEARNRRVEVTVR